MPVERQVEAVGFAQDATGVAVTLRHLQERGREEHAEAAWLLATDGAASSVRGWLKLPWETHRFAGQHVFQIDARTSWELPLAPGHGYFFLHEEGYFGCVPLLDGYHRFFVSQSDTKKSEVSDPQLEDMERLITHLSGFTVKLSDPRWLSGKHYQNVLTSTFRVGRVLLAGDAGKSVVPLNGQGMNTGIQDAFNLSWKLASVQKGLAPDGLLDSYNEERYPVASHLVDVTGKYFTHVTEPNKLQEIAVRSFGGLLIANK